MYVWSSVNITLVLQAAKSDGHTKKLLLPSTYGQPF